MLYLDYEILKSKYEKAQTLLDELLDEREVIFLKTQPQGLKTDSEKVTSSGSQDKFDIYLIEKEKRRIDQRIKEARKLVTARAMQMEMKEEELEKSMDVYDRVYVLSKLKCRRIKQISKEVGYSERQVLRIIKNINQRVKLSQNVTLGCAIM